MVNECKKLIIEMCNMVLARLDTDLSSFTDLLLTTIKTSGNKSYIRMMLNVALCIDNIYSVTRVYILYALCYISIGLHSADHNHIISPCTDSDLCHHLWSCIFIIHYMLQLCPCIMLLFSGLQLWQLNSSIRLLNLMQMICQN